MIALKFPRSTRLGPRKERLRSLPRARLAMRIKETLSQRIQVCAMFAVGVRVHMLKSCHSFSNEPTTQAWIPCAISLTVYRHNHLHFIGEKEEVRMYILRQCTVGNGTCGDVFCDRFVLCFSPKSLRILAGFLASKLATQ